MCIGVLSRRDYNKQLRVDTLLIKTLNPLHIRSAILRYHHLCHICSTTILINLSQIGTYSHTGNGGSAVSVTAIVKNRFFMSQKNKKNVTFLVHTYNYCSTPTRSVAIINNVKNLPWNCLSPLNVNECFYDMSVNWISRAMHNTLGGPYLHYWLLIYYIWLTDISGYTRQLTTCRNSEQVLNNNVPHKTYIQIFLTMFWNIWFIWIIRFNVCSESIPGTLDY